MSVFLQLSLTLTYHTSCAGGCLVRLLSVLRVVHWLNLRLGKILAYLFLLLRVFLLEWNLVPSKKMNVQSDVFRSFHSEHSQFFQLREKAAQKPHCSHSFLISPERESRGTLQESSHYCSYSWWLVLCTIQTDGNQESYLRFCRCLHEEWRRREE